MPLIDLPRTAGCIVCGPANPHGLRLTSRVDPTVGTVHTPFTPAPHHIGFDGLVHGGVIATVVDEAMVWAAIWSTRRACVAGELAVRFRRPSTPGVPVTIVASVTRTKARLVETTASVTTAAGDTVATATAKYLAGSEDDTATFLRTLLHDESAATAIAYLHALPASTTTPTPGVVARG
jgi:uncharacterized protein (TIGR00369 family)